MIKRIVVAGCRNYDNYSDAKAFMDECVKELQEQYTLVIISGGCKGADQLGERYAKEKGFAIELYPADWKKYGRNAGLIRNEQMAKACDLAVCFWDGKSRGTASMIGYVTKLEKPLKIKYI